MKIKILLAEDDATMRGLLKTLLEFEGYEIILSDARGDNIIELIRIAPPHFLILDYHLGNVSGIDILNTIKRVVNLRTPIVLMTSGEDRKDQCLEAGADGFLLKPYMPDELINWLREREGKIDKQEG
jgi:DNA-binding response OmpR family regulator